MEIDRLLRAARRARTLSQRELAQLSGVAVSTVGRIESGTMRPTVAMLQALLGSSWWGWFSIAWSRTDPVVPPFIYFRRPRHPYVLEPRAQVVPEAAQAEGRPARLPAVLAPVTALRYVTPLREGGSLPGVMEADDLGTYVVKYVGAGQGRKALVAEVIVGVLAQSLGLPVPRLVTVDLDPVLAANEPDEEVQALLRASGGRNLGVDFLPGALDLDVNAFAADPMFAGAVLVFDALVANVDRSWRNPNMLFWHGAPYLIDHGAALTFHHNWPTATASAARPYDASEHAFIGAGPDLSAGVERILRPDLGVLVRAAVDEVPAEWLTDEPGFESPDAVRTAYVEWFAARITAADIWLAGLRAAAAAGLRPRATARARPEWLR